MTSHRGAGLGRSVLGLGLAALLALTACEKGPDRAKVAAELKAGVEEQLKKAEGPAGQQVLSHTAVNVTPQDDDAYLVSIEGLKVHPSPEGYLEVGTVSYLAKPKDETSYEVSNLTVPQTMPFKGPDGKEKGKLTVTTKSFSGVYSKALTTFQQMDAEFADIIATDDQGGDVGARQCQVHGQHGGQGRRGRRCHSQGNSDRAHREGGCRRHLHRSPKRRSTPNTIRGSWRSTRRPRSNTRSWS